MDDPLRVGGPACVTALVRENRNALKAKPVLTRKNPRCERYIITDGSDKVHLIARIDERRGVELDSHCAAYGCAGVLVVQVCAQYPH